MDIRGDLNNAAIAARFEPRKPRFSLLDILGNLNPSVAYLNTENFLKEGYSFRMACMTYMSVLVVYLTFGEVYDVPERAHGFVSL